MEHIDPLHVSLESESQLAYPLREPVIHSQPKSQCGHHCVHQSYFSVPCGSSSRHLPTACTCSNLCTRTCFTSFSSPLPHHIRSSCNGTTICDCHQRTHVHEPQATPPIGHLAFPPYYSCQQRSSNNRRYPDYPRPSRAIHLATNNLSYPSPHYATAYAPSNEVHSSWQPTYHREYHTQIDDLRSSSAVPDMHSHIHHHITAEVSPTTCTQRFFPLHPITVANIARTNQISYASSHHIRRHTSRLSPYPYPSVIHFPYTIHHPPRYICSTPYLLPPRHLIASGFNLVNELEIEPTDGEYESNRRSVGPKGLTKDLIEKLPHYLVTKKTMEEFTDRERCVVCMCEFDVGETLRILPCAHEFHSPCVDKWLEGNATCPICRSAVEVS